MAIKMTPTRQRLLARWKASGLDAAAFAAIEGEPVTERRLVRWQWKAKQLGNEVGATKPAFVRLERAPLSQPALTTGLEVVSTTGRLVRVPVGFDAVTLTRLLVVVEGVGQRCRAGLASCCV